MAYVIQHLSLSPTSWYGGPLLRWVTSLGSAVSYADAASAQTVIDTYRMYAVPAVNPPGQVMLVNSPASVVSGDVVAFADASGTALSDSLRKPGNIRNVTTLGVGSGTYTPTANSGLLVAECVGGGGGGGGVASPTGTNVGLAGGGGGGGYVKKFYIIPNQTFTYVVGAKGTGGAAGNNAGNTGGNTTFTGSLAGTATASGGPGGLAGTTGAAPLTVSKQSGGNAVGGDLNIGGGSSSAGMSSAQLATITAAGGDSVFGYGAKAGNNANVNSGTAGNAANGKGGGGSGACANGTGGPQAGGDGTDGTIIITEYE